jgi:hypothetical protein
MEDRGSRVGQTKRGLDLQGCGDVIRLVCLCGSGCKPLGMCPAPVSLRGLPPGYILNGFFFFYQTVLRALLRTCMGCAEVNTGWRNTPFHADPDCQ